MTLRRVMIALLAAAVVAGPAGRDGLGPGQGDVRPARSCTAPAPTRRAASRSPTGSWTTSRCSTSATAASTASSSRGGVRDPVRHQAGRRVLRAAEGQERRRVVFNPLQHRHHLPAHPQGRRSTRSSVHSMGYGMTAAADGRWFPWVFNFPTTYWSQASAVIRYIGAAGGRARQAEGQEDRPHLPQQPVRQGSQPDPRGAGPQVRLRADAARGGPSGPGAEGHVAPGAAAQPGLDLHVRAGA